MHDQFVIKNIGELITNAAVCARGNTSLLAGAEAERNLAILKNAWLAIAEGKVNGIGHGRIDASYSSWKHIDIHGGLVMPGLIDSHTHPLFAGSRASEFVQRAQGKSYQEIAESGGGIQYTVKQTRDASDEELLQLVLKRLVQMLNKGITTIEVKTGYGLNVSEELRHLKILNIAKKMFPGTLYITCLPLHAASPETPSNGEYIADVNQRLIPQVKKNNLADAFDVFIEDGYFNADECECYAEKLSELGLHLRIHADEFSASGAAEFAGKWHARSADHLQFSSEKGLAAMAEAGCIATLLPGTSLYTNIPFTDASKIAATGCEIAVASDYNPGSCQMMNLSQIASIATIHSGLDPALALLGVTFVAAKSLNLQHCKGFVDVGADADILVYESLGTWQDWLYDFGQTPASTIFVKGCNKDEIKSETMIV